MIYVYDNTFYGMLTAVYYHYYEKKADQIFADAKFGGHLVDEIRYIETHSIYAEKVEKAMYKKLSREGYLSMYRTFLSSEENKDTYILKYLEKGFKLGEKIDRLYADPDVIHIRELSKKVGFEAHRFLGLLRFEQKFNYLYGRYEPDHDITELIAQHFADRLKNEMFIIHDAKRKKMMFSNQGKWYIEQSNKVEVMERLLREEQAEKKVMYNEEDYQRGSLGHISEEAMIQALWKKYFERIGIEGRKNLKLQQSFVPLKYRKNILEFVEEK